MDIIFGPGTFARVGEVARDHGMRRPLVVADAGIVAAGYVAGARRSLEAAGLSVVTFHDFAENPDTDMVERGREAAASARIDGLIGLGGGSSLDCARGINFVLTNGGSMADYRGYGKAAAPMLPMIGIPTTAGTGSDAQSYALISDARTHEKMACGDPKAACAAVILDPALTVSQPRHVTAAAGYDALAHAVETWVTTKRSPRSAALSREAWGLLAGAYERVLASPGDIDARGCMLRGAHLAGAAIEQSMLGATHACANPLTARYGTTHGVAIAMLLRHVVRWNSSATTEVVALRTEGSQLCTEGSQPPGGRSATTSVVANIAERYAELDRDLSRRLDAMAVSGEFPRGLAAAGASEDDLDRLSRAAAAQWTGTFNPRPFDVQGAREIYEMAW